jgi:GT2 family glycosyltransferase
MWRDLRSETKDGKFLSFVFNHNVHEARGHTFLETMAESDYLVFLQDDNLLNTNCLWIEDILTTFRSWPKVAAIGLWKASMSHASENTTKFWELHDWPDAYESYNFLLRDPITNVRMHFVTQANMAPMAFRRSPFLSLGGFDLGIYGQKGECGMFQDEDLSVRLTLAGYQIVHLFIREQFGVGPEGSGTRSGGKANYIRYQNMFLEEVYKNFTLQSFGQRIEDEVMRLNQHKLVPNSFPPPHWHIAND